MVPGTFSLRWVGLAYYRGIFRSIFESSGPTSLDVYFKNTYIFVGLGLAVETVGGVALALLLARRMRGVGAFRVIYALPLLVATVGAAVTWSALLNASNGWVDYFLGLVGLGQPVWLADSRTAMLSVVIADAWTGIPVVAFIVLAGLLSMPRDPVEAARVDGAGAFQTFRYVTLSALRPVLAFAVLFRMLELFQQFVLFQVMTGFGPVTATSLARGSAQAITLRTSSSEVIPAAAPIRPAWRSVSIPSAIAALRISSACACSTIMRSISSLTLSTSWTANRPA